MKKTGLQPNLIFWLLLCAFIILSCKEEHTVISGKITVAGHDPFTYVRLIDQKKIEYKLLGPKVEILRDSYQGKDVKLAGKVVKEAIGPGFPAEFLVVKIVE